MNTIYENNLKALKQKNEKLWEAFYTYAKQQKESRAFTAVAKNGEVIIGYHGKDRDFNLNSTYNPSKEAEKLMAEYDTIPDNSFSHFDSISIVLFSFSSLSITFIT